MSSLTPTAPERTATVSAPSRRSGRSRFYPWLVFALTFGLLLSDYMSRQVLSAVFPFLKAEWSLSDSHLASLNSVVALMVGLLTLPLSMLADRWGRVRSLVVMAALWSVATLLCAVAGSYEQMLGARFLVGVGEAAYGSVGIAVVLSVFAPRLRASLSGAFMAGGSFGSVIGVAFGGVIAVQLSWRWSFASMAIFGLILVALFWALVSERKLARHAIDDDTNTTHTEAPGPVARAPISSLFTNPAVLCAYIGGGLQMFTAAALMAWLPSFFGRSYGLAADKAAAMAAVFVLLIGAGMIVCGIVADRAARIDPARKWTVAIAISLAAGVLLIVGFRLPVGTAQLVLLGLGAFFSAGSTGAVTAMVANLTHPTVRASAFGTTTLANSLLGLAAGPFVVGVLADRISLANALQLAPLVYLGAVAVLLAGKRVYPAGVRKLATLSATPAQQTGADK
ncbi:MULTISPECIES: MFS transporter [Rhodococcus]|uniref:Transporter, MFS superfamily n=3 Tax=Rhodococcus TaxID=1827 RepID=A0ABQ0YJV9_9NOCA|nr:MULTISPECIES: MFS transporter [Rhodococcus]ETT27165.1 major facilitator superfamily MFS_1 [Rhodococcus rhodochrous ATCC 21198]AKE91399.1 multidrug DMT transporter permease [Rhodococcus aetherivorans]ANZ23771.1 multidrug DMT transporter permease [Rhodococcus sp. WB1]MBC2589153.1 MFS transporter [Rhodococcus aetherivorans]MDV6294121.1 MFS transporter [Rhodococcus aetherivorans]